MDTNQQPLEMRQAVVIFNTFCADHASAAVLELIGSLIYLEDKPSWHSERSLVAKQLRRIADALEK